MANPTKRLRRTRGQGTPGTRGVSSRAFRGREHYVVALDRSRLRIYRERRAPGLAHSSLELVEAIDFPEGVENSVGREPASADTERLPMLREHERRRANDLAAELDGFLSNRPSASWDLAASPTVCRAVIARLSHDIQHRLRHSVLKDLAKASPADLQFGAA